MAVTRTQYLNELAELTSKFIFNFLSSGVSTQLPWRSSGTSQINRCVEIDIGFLYIVDYINWEKFRWKNFGGKISVIFPKFQREQWKLRENSSQKTLGEKKLLLVEIFRT